jgi:hypothetical protein
MSGPSGGRRRPGAPRRPPSRQPAHPPLAAAYPVAPLAAPRVLLPTAHAGPRRPAPASPTPDGPPRRPSVLPTAHASLPPFPDTPG